MTEGGARRLIHELVKLTQLCVSLWSLCGHKTGAFKHRKAITGFCSDQSCGAGSREPAIVGGAGDAFKIQLEPELVVNLAAPTPDLFCALTVAMVRSCCATN